MMNIIFIGKYKVNIYCVLLSAMLLLTFASCSSSRKLTNKNNENHNVRNENSKSAEFYKKYSDRFNIRLSGHENKDLILFIDKWYGTPYKLGGTSLLGTDCSGFAGNLYNDVYKLKISRTVKSIFQECTPVDKDHLREGDFVFFRIENAKEVNHIGVYVSDYKFVHASTKKGVIISDLREDYYKKFFFSGGRLKK